MGEGSSALWMLALSLLKPSDYELRTCIYLAPSRRSFGNIMPDPGPYVENRGNDPSWSCQASRPLKEKNYKKSPRSENPERTDAQKLLRTQCCGSQSRLSNGLSSSHGNGFQNGHGHGSLSKRNSDLVLEGLEDEPSASIPRSEGSCLSIDAPAVPVNRKACDDDLAQSSVAAVKGETKITTLESECARLHISSARSFKSTRLRKLSPPEPELRKVNCSLPTELIQGILGRFHWRHVMQLLCVLGRFFEDLISQEAFLRHRPSTEAEYRPVFFTTADAGDLHWTGFNTSSREWEAIPTLNFAKDKEFPSPDKDLFKDYLMAGDEGLLCINVGKSTGRAELVVCNPLTRQVQSLPPLKCARHPVLMHFKMDHGSGHYMIVVAGSASIGTEHLSLKIEEYSSRTREWVSPEDSDMPGPAFGLNEYQNGVYYADSTRELLLCVVILNTGNRGVLAYDLKQKKWKQSSSKFHIPLVTSSDCVGSLATTQLVKCGESVFVFSEQECGKEVFFLIHKLNLDFVVHNPWEEILCRKKLGGRGLLVYPEFTCVAVSDHELSIFNSVEHTMEIIDVDNPTAEGVPLPAPVSTGNKFYSLNTIGFAYRPSFKNDVYPLP